MINEVASDNNPPSKQLDSIQAGTRKLKTSLWPHFLTVYTTLILMLMSSWGALKLMRRKFYFKSFTFMSTFLILIRLLTFISSGFLTFIGKVLWGENVQGRRVVHRDHGTDISIEKESMHSHGITSTR
jgi:hypothetical protein